MSGALAATVLLSLLSAVAYALAAVVQERLAAAPRWWMIIALNGGGALLHVGALAYGSLAVVQPLGALTLVVALPVGAAVTGRRVRGREWRGALTTVAGLMALLLAVGTATPTQALTDGQVALLVLVATTLIVGLAGRAYRAAPGPARLPGLRLAAAGGIAFAASSALTQTVLLRIGTGGLAALERPTIAGTTLTVVALSAAGLLLSQAAYRYGLGGPLATLTIVNPVAAAGIGVVLLGLGAGLTSDAVAAAVVAAVVAGAGVVLLATPGPAARRPACRRALRRVRRRPGRRSVAQRNRRPASRTASFR
jgi:drug/metabolite transporter (DMT)-like permease